MHTEMQDSNALRELRAYAKILLAEEAGVPTAPRPAATPVPVRRVLLRPRSIIAAAILFVLGNAGLAAASDSAVPGDLLYPLDRAYEAVGSVLGFQHNPQAERLEEARVLLDRGEVNEAIETATGTLGNEMADDTRDLTGYNAELGSIGDAGTHRADVRAAVSALIEAIRTSDQDTIKQAARTVAETARGALFTDNQGPGKDKTAGEASPGASNPSDEHRTVPDLPDAAIEHRNSSTTTTVASEPSVGSTVPEETTNHGSADNPGNGNGNGNGPPDNPGNGNPHQG